MLSRKRHLLIVLGVIAVGLVSAPAATAILPGPNGKIVFTSGRDDGTTALDDAHAQLWVAEKAGATPVRVTADTTVQHRHASWSPDRTKLVYSAGVAGDFDIWILDLTQPISSTNPTDITQSPGVADDRPSWSPDGTRVAYQSKQLVVNPPPAQIVVQEVAAPMSTISLTQPAGTGDAGKPVWSNDSNTLLYSLVVNPGGSPVDDDIYSKAADDSGTATPIVTGSTDDYQPAVSPDGQSLCFTRGAFGTTNATVQRSTITGTDVTEIANSGLGDYNCAWSPDGTEIAYVQGTFGNGDLMVKSSDGTGTSTDLVPNVAGRFDGNPEWTRNPSPTCQSRSVTIAFNSTASIPLSCVDPAPENDPVTLAIVDAPTHGTLGNLDGASIPYTPRHNFAGADTFTFKGNDGTSDSNVATIHVRVRPPPAPVVSALRVHPSRWRLGSRLAHISRRGTPVGTRISFRLSKRAAVKLTFARAKPGRRVGGRCVAVTHANRHRRHCTRYRGAGVLRFKAHKGLNTIRFDGRLSRTKTLADGRYRLSVRAVDSFGSHSHTRSVAFTIVGR